MRLLAAALLVAFTATAANAGGPFVILLSSSFQNGVACQVKHVTVLAQNAKDCHTIRGKVIKAQPAK